MRAVVLHVSDQELAERHRRGLDRFDEMWHGVLHMAPAPALEHQRIVGELHLFLGPLIRQAGRGTLRLGINVFDERSSEPDYRIPDFTFIAAGREALLTREGIRGGAPDAVIEIPSPDDETYDKLSFFARLGVREVIVVDRDTRQPELYRLAGSQYIAVQVDADGWLRSEAMRVRFGHAEGRGLAVEDLEDSTARADV